MPHSARYNDRRRFRSRFRRIFVEQLEPRQLLAPITAADGYVTEQDVPLVVQAPGILVNDHDTVAGELSAVLIDGPTHGTIDLSSGGGFRYAPQQNYSGTDRFTYRAKN